MLGPVVDTELTMSSRHNRRVTEIGLNSGMTKIGLDWKQNIQNLENRVKSVK